MPPAFIFTAGISADLPDEFIGLGTTKSGYINIDGVGDLTYTGCRSNSLLRKEGA